MFAAFPTRACRIDALKDTIAELSSVPRIDSSPLLPWASEFGAAAASCTSDSCHTVTSASGLLLLSAYVAELPVPGHDACAALLRPLEKLECITAEAVDAVCSQAVVSVRSVWSLTPLLGRSFRIKYRQPENARAVDMAPSRLYGNSRVLG